jgi:hypothetical protein
MKVFLVFRSFPNEQLLKFCKTTKDKVNKSLPYIGLLTEERLNVMGGMLLTMARDDKIVLFRNKNDEGFLSVTVQSSDGSRMGWLDAAAAKGDVILVKIGRDTDFEIIDELEAQSETLYRSREPASEFQLAAVHSEVDNSRYCIWWDDKITPMPQGTQLYARKSDIAKLSGNALKDAGFKVADIDDRTGTLLMTLDGGDHTEH